jgi:CheY-like chemotaxis protein
MGNENAKVKNILLIEDDPRDVELTMAVLEAQAWIGKVEVVNDGAEALDYLYRRGKFAARGEASPSVIILDNKMPKVNGLEVLKIIKGDPQLKMIPVVALTSSREATDLSQFYEHGVNAYVVKPLEFSEFVEAVKQISHFWTEINESPLVTKLVETVRARGDAPSRGEGALKT